MAQIWIEVIGDPCLESVEVDIDEERIAAGLDPRERPREQFRQCGPVEPVSAHRSRLERQAESGIGLQDRIARIDSGVVETV